MPVNGIIERKFSMLDDYILNLQRELSGQNFETFQSDWVLQRMTERSLQVMIEIVIDVAERILAIRQAGPASTSGKAIDKLVTLGILESAEPYRAMIRFRNLIVQLYDEIDPSILLFDLATTRLVDFRKFRDEIDRVQ